MLEKKSTLYIGVLVVIVMAFLYSSKLNMPRGIRNNNPLNIRENDLNDDDWVGELSYEVDESFEEFESPLMGFRAAAKVLKNYKVLYGLNTIKKIISRWAPSSENNTQSYIDSVSNQTGIGANEILNDADYISLIKAMVVHENGKNPYDDKVIIDGFNLGWA